jgi:hypothetical protein
MKYTVDVYQKIHLLMLKCGLKFDLSKVPTGGVKLKICVLVDTGSSEKH